METQQLTFETITTPTTLSQCVTLALINQSSTDVVDLNISGQSTSITIQSGQTLELNSSTGFVLPDIEITGTNINVDVVISK